MQRFALLLLLALVAGTAGATPRTLRIDYFHTGNINTELFSLDQVVLEPLAFPGNLQQPIDHLLRGKYLFEAIEPESGKVIWSRSFNAAWRLLSWLRSTR